MGTVVERDLKTLRTSKLMSSCPEYISMMGELEKFHKEQTKMKGKNEKRELDLRPYLYDNGDTYEKPFYNILLKLLYDVVSFQSAERQHKDVLKVYEWFLSHHKLITEDATKNDEDGYMVDSKNIEIPKLYLRPKSADGNCYRESRDSPDMKYQRETHSKSALGSYENERNKKKKDYNPLDTISVSLKVLPLNGSATKLDEFGSTVTCHDGHPRFNKRNGAPSIAIHVPKKPLLPSSFVLKPCNQTSPPVSTPVSSPSVSPRLSRRILSPSQSPRLSPVAKSCSNLSTHRSGKAAKALPDKQSFPGETSDFEVEHTSLKTNNHGQSSKKIDDIRTREISNTILVADEEGGLFQDQLKQRFQNDRRKKEVKLVEQLKKDTEYLRQEEESLQSQLLGEHEQILREENETGLRIKERRESAELQTSSRGVSTLPTVNIYDVSSHRPVSAVEFRNKDVRIESVLDMVQPVSEQMKYQREMQRNGASIWDREPVSYKQEHSQMFQRLNSAPSRTSLPGGIDRLDNQRILNHTEPILNPERRASDYTVHFPHQSNREPSVKEFKVSGPVSPDSIRYQWTDDGFGNRTYFKKRSPLESSQSHKSPRSSPPVNDVSMITGERGLDKRTIASLMVIKHLGTSRRRESFETEQLYPKLIDDSMEHCSPYDNTYKDVEPKHNVEYLPFWRQMPPRKGLSIVNIPEDIEPDVNTINNTRLKITTLDENRNSIKEPSSSPTTAQTILNEMFSCLTPQRRTLRNGLDTSSLSVKARSISPEPRRPQAPPACKPESRDLRPAPSPTPVNSRPTSARRSKDKSPVNFSVKQFSHFCLDDDMELLDDYKRQREIWAAINIQRIFRGHIARQYATSLKQAEKERQRKAAVALQSTFRGYLARKKMMRQNLLNYKPGIRDLQWAREYKGKLREKELSRHRRNKGILRQQNRQYERQQEQISGVKASDMIHEIFNPPKATKAQMRSAAITIQRYFRGWFVRKSLKTVKERASKRTFSFNKFIKSYQDLVYRIQKRYNIENPNTALQFHELQEYVDRLFKYEIAFGKIAENGTLKYEDILKYFAECGHHPSEKEIEDAVAMVIKDSPKGRNLTKSEAVEIVFQIYIPKGTGLNLADVRKSTWMNPLIDGQDVKKILSKKDLEFTSLDKVLTLVADSQTDRNEVKELLRAPDPQIMNVVEKAQEGFHPESKDNKQKPRLSSAKSPGGGHFILARGQHEPVKPSENKQNKKRRPVSGRIQK
ncbi:uncharacterized protein LOC114524554 isoform X2 [Dendronephthya gigantea]|uniref:uncharacterized protein LOC114524554 isoform X2 n=1 Tax=Dendronephthya gigantea TaxID=151771 RepID=UPI00106DC43C|nr:uncharacterized protein LOC114524554 isoform X2 [Dendronephthya gigantea]